VLALLGRKGKRKRSPTSLLKAILHFTPGEKKEEVRREEPSYLNWEANWFSSPKQNNGKFYRDKIRKEREIFSHRGCSWKSINFLVTGRRKGGGRRHANPSNGSCC